LEHVRLGDRVRAAAADVWPGRVEARRGRRHHAAFLAHA
jgi:hypothetical protein